ncbi:MAG TPA: hypothetical protein VH120_19860, partial [Gemmataceae bacterium]|nr:hypothetical protein [Gemmataceae bacterium]
MSQFRSSSGPPRRGVILLVVVLMLALFLVVGLSFVLYAESEATSSRTYREAATPDIADIAPETLLNAGIGQLIYGVPDDATGAESALRGHEFGRLIYGWHYAGLQGNPFVPDANHTNNPWDATKDPNSATNPKAAYGPYSNTTPFNGIGPLRNLPLPSALASSGVKEYDLINYTWFASDSPPFVRDPEHPAAAANAYRADPTQALPPYAGGFNIPYTYPDRTNMFLAVVQTTDSTQIDPTTHQPVVLNPPRMIVQSFARSTATLPYVSATANALQIDPTSKGGQTFWNSPPSANNAAWKYLVLRPRPGDQLLAGETLFQDSDGVWKANGPAGLRLAFPPPADFGGDVKNLPGVPLTYTYTNAKNQKVQVQAQNDSFWMDLNYPVQITKNGRKYKPLFAFLIMDLDGKINLNMHGNVNANVVQGKNVIPNQHASNQAIGRHEVNVAKVLTAANVDFQNNVVPEWTWLFVGNRSAAALANPSASALARYGPPPPTGAVPPYPVPGTFSAVVGPTNPNQYPDPYATNVERSLLFPIDSDAVDPVNNKQITQRFDLPFAYPSYASFPQFSTTGYDNFTYDQNQPQQNPRLNHPLLNQKLRGINYTMISTQSGPTQVQTINDDQPFADDNMFQILAGDYRKSALYGLIPNNLGGDGSNAQLTVLGNKVRQLISTRGYDLDAPGAPPWIVDATTQATAYTLQVPKPPNPSPPNPFLYPTGATPFVTLPPAQIPAVPPTTASDYKAGDGRANLLSRVDLARKLTPFVDPATGVFNVADKNGKSVPPPTVYPNNVPIAVNGVVSAATLSQFPLATYPQLRYYYAMADRQQFAQDIFDRLVKSTGAVPPALLKAGTATAEQYAATRWLAQLAVNIVDYVDEDDIVTPFQWNPAPDMTLDSSNGAASTAPGWVFGTEAPNLVINEAYCELQNDPLNQNGNFQYSFWLELYNPLPAGSPATPVPAYRQDPTKQNRDRLAVPLEYSTATAGTYPVYQVVIAADPNAPHTSTKTGPKQSQSDKIKQLMWPPQNTDGWLSPGDQKSFVKIQLTSFAGTPHPANTDYKYVAPTTNVFSTHQPTQLPSNQGFYVLAPDQQHDFVSDPGAAGANTFKPTLQLSPFQPTPQQSQATPPPGQLQKTPWGTVVQGGTVWNGLTYPAPAAPPSSTGTLPDAVHAIMLRRLACPYLDPNPIDLNAPVVPGQPPPLLFPDKPFNPYITVDYMNNVPTYDAVKNLHSTAGKATPNYPPQNQNGTYTPRNQRYSVGRRQPYAASLIADAPPNNPNPINHTFFSHNSATSTQANSPTLDFPFDWYVHLDRAPSNVMDILQVSAVRPHQLTQQFITGQFGAAKFKGTPTSETKFQHLAPWSDQSARIYRALEYFTVGDRSPYPGTLGRVAGKINPNTYFDRDILDATVDAHDQPNPKTGIPRTGNIFFETTGGPTPTGAVTDVWQGKQSASLAQTLFDYSNVSFLNRKQQILGIGAVPDRPFWPLSAPAVSKTTTFPGDPQYQVANPSDPNHLVIDLAGIAGTILSYPDPNVAPGTTPDPIGTFCPVKLPPAGGGTPDYSHSIDYPAPPNPPQVFSYTPTLPPYVLDELLSKVSGHMTPRSNNFAVFLTVGFFEVMDDTTLPVKLGAEIKNRNGQPTRHRMFAVVDRTN